MGTSLSRQNSTTIKRYNWSTEELCQEYALLYTSTGRQLPPRYCSFYYRVKRDKVVFTMYDGLCLGTQVRVNMELVAVRDAERRHKFGPVKFRYCGTRFNEQILRLSKRNVLYLKYPDAYEFRTNQLGLYRYKKENEYRVIFYTGIASDEYFTHTVSIHCDPSNGINVNLSGPYRHRAGEEELCDTEYRSSIPPDNVMKTVHDIRNNELKIEEDGISGGNTTYNSVINKGNVQGDGNGCIINDRRRYGGGRIGFR